MSEVLATFIGGKLAMFNPATVGPAPPSPAVTTILKHDADRDGSVPATTEADPLAEIAALLARAAKIVKNLDEADRRRARELFSASLSLLAATTSLRERDQALLNAALREA